METGSEGAAWLSLHMEEGAIGEEIQGILEATAKPVSGILSGCFKRINSTDELGFSLVGPLASSTVR